MVPETLNHLHNFLNILLLLFLSSLLKEAVFGTLISSGPCPWVGGKQKFQPAGESLDIGQLEPRLPRHQLLDNGSCLNVSFIHLLQLLPTVEFPCFGPLLNDLLGQWSNCLCDETQVIVVLAPLLTSLWLEEESTSGEFKGSASSSPHVHTWAIIPHTDENFRSTILPSPDLHRKPLVDPARSSQVCDLHFQRGTFGRVVLLSSLCQQNVLKFHVCVNNTSTAMQEVEALHDLGHHLLHLVL